MGNLGGCDADCRRGGADDFPGAFEVDLASLGYGSGGRGRGDEEGSGLGYYFGWGEGGPRGGGGLARSLGVD
jgi:hypothetical protein